MLSGGKQKIDCILEEVFMKAVVDMSIYRCTTHTIA